MDNDELWNEYVNGKQTYSQLAEKFGCSIKTIQRRIDLVKVDNVNSGPSEVILLMDTTYFGRGFGVMLFKDSTTGTNLYKQYVKYETNLLYRAGVEQLQNRGIKIKAIVCDGRKGLFHLFSDIPVQMCQFHQVAIITRYLTRRPKLEAAIELTSLVRLLPHTDKESFIGGLGDWQLKWSQFLNERTTDPITGKSWYTHKKLRSAYRSLKTNLSWLFTWYDQFELGIPNTTNAIDGHFAGLKNKLRNHNGLSLKRKRKFIDEFLKA